MTDYLEDPFKQAEESYKTEIDLLTKSIGEKQRKLYDGTAEDFSPGRTIAKAIATALPMVLGYAVKGSAGGFAGGKVSGDMLTSIEANEDRREKEKNAQLSAEISLLDADRKSKREQAERIGLEGLKDRDEAIDRLPGGSDYQWEDAKATFEANKPVRPTYKDLAASNEEIDRARSQLVALGQAKDLDKAAEMLPYGTNREMTTRVVGGEARRGNELGLKSEKQEGEFTPPPGLRFKVQSDGSTPGKNAFNLKEARELVPAYGNLQARLSEFSDAMKAGRLATGENLAEQVALANSVIRGIKELPGSNFGAALTQTEAGVYLDVLSAFVKNPTKPLRSVVVESGLSLEPDAMPRAFNKVLSREYKSKLDGLGFEFETGGSDTASRIAAAISKARGGK